MAGPWDAVDQGRIEPVRLYPDIALDTARSSADPLEIPIAGDAFYLTDDTTGKVYIRLNDKDGARLPASAGFAVTGPLFKRLYLDWTAQAGKVAQIAYATGVRFAPSNDVQNIGGISSTVTVQARSIPAGISSFYRRGASAALQTVVAPAANTNGIRIYSLSASSYGFNRTMIKASAPTSIDDAAAVTLLTAGIGSNNQYQRSYLLPLPIDVPAGMGLYTQDNQAAWQSHNDIAYEVL